MKISAYLIVLLVLLNLLVDVLSVIHTIGLKEAFHGSRIIMDNDGSRSFTTEVYHNYHIADSWGGKSNYRFWAVHTDGSTSYSGNYDNSGTQIFHLYYNKPISKYYVQCLDSTLKCNLNGFFVFTFLVDPHVAPGPPGSKVEPFFLYIDDGQCLDALYVGGAIAGPYTIEWTNTMTQPTRLEVSYGNPDRTTEIYSYYQSSVSQNVSGGGNVTLNMKLNICNNGGSTGDFNGRLIYYQPTIPAKDGYEIVKFPFIFNMALGETTVVVPDYELGYDGRFAVDVYSDTSESSMEYTLTFWFNDYMYVNTQMTTLKGAAFYELVSQVPFVRLLLRCTLSSGCTFNGQMIVNRKLVEPPVAESTIVIPPVESKSPVTPVGSAPSLRTSSSRIIAAIVVLFMFLQ